MRTFILLLALALGAIGALYQLDGGEPTAGAPVPASLPC